jgi:hypothetical protein
MYFMRHDCDEVEEATDKGKSYEEGFLEALGTAYLGWLGFHLGFTIYFESGRLILYSGMF